MEENHGNHETGNSLIPVEGLSPELSAMAKSGRQIASMDEPFLLTTEQLEAKNLIHPGMKNLAVADIFRELRTRLLQTSEKNNFVTMVTSVCGGGGASYIAMNIAVAFSFDTSKTALLVDCNLRQPSLHQVFDIKPEYGLTDLLEDPDIAVEEILYATGVKRLRVIPVGRQREATTEFFTSVRMRMLLDAVKSRYPDRYIILDAPSIGETADARILAELCDYSIVVVPYGRVTQAQISAAIDVVGRDKLMGVVLNNQPSMF